MLWFRVPRNKDTDSAEDHSSKEEFERKLNLWEGYIRENGQDIIKRSERCEYGDEMQFDATVLSLTGNGETRTYVYRPGEREGSYDFFGEYIFLHRGLSESCRSMEYIYRWVSGEVAYRVYKRRSIGKIVNIIPFEEMLL
jgi:hypothetical protein